MSDPGAPLAVTMGEPAGIGGELTLKAWRLCRDSGSAAFFAIDSVARLRALAARLGLDVPVIAISRPEEARTRFAEGLPVLGLADPASGGDPALAASLEAAANGSGPARASAASAPAVIASIDRAVALALGGAAAGVVTQPIQKESLYAAAFAHPGHTEYLADLCGLDHPPVMMLASPELKVVPVTIHQSLASVAGSLTVDAIEAALVTTARALVRDFGIAAPRIAVAGLNPHAGEGGRMGDEEGRIIRPAMEAATRALAASPGAGPDTHRGRGIGSMQVTLTGPHSADTLFHAAARRRYDAAVCMYHDQALIPIKTIDFDRGVNVTLGLPIVRTSPDHGTALDIAGQGIARPDSVMAAIDMAAKMGRNRMAASS